MGLSYIFLENDALSKYRIPNTNNIAIRVPNAEYRVPSYGNRTELLFFLGEHCSESAVFRREAIRSRKQRVYEDIVDDYDTVNSRKIQGRGVYDTIHKLTHQKILKVWDNVVKTVTKIGFDVVATMTDGHSTNTAFYENLVKELPIKKTDIRMIQNPYDQQGTIRLLFDTVHIFKNFYSNFLNYNILDFPEFVRSGEIVMLQARFDDIKKLYDLEICKPERMAHKLNKKMLDPSSIEKTNVALANACFHESTINGLLYYSKRGFPSFENTAAFLKIIRRWFNVVNVRSKCSAQKTRDEGRDAIYYEDRHQLEFLQDFYEWLDRWSQQNGQGLSNQTFHHSKVTTLNFIHLCNYLLDKKGLDYVLYVFRN